MSTRIYRDGTLRQWWDDATRTYTEYTAAGSVVSSRPYTAAENTQADAEAAATIAQGNESSTRTKLAQDFVDLQTTIGKTNATINQNPAADIKVVARAVRRLTRIALGVYDGSD